VVELRRRPVVIGHWRTRGVGECQVMGVDIFVVWRNVKMGG